MMPKINVYLPDELAEGVKEAGVPVSAICQRALEQSVKRVTAIRAADPGDLEALDPAHGPIARLSQFTERARTAIKLGIEQARADGVSSVGTEHLLHGLLAEGGNLAVQVLRAVEIEPDHLARELARVSSTAINEAMNEAMNQVGEPPAGRFSGPAANALEQAVTEALTLGHNYVGCEHLLLGLIAEPDGTGGQVLRAGGAELRSTRGAVVAALAGYVHLRAQTARAQTAAGSPVAPADTASVVAAAVRRELQPLVGRIERLEEHTGLIAESGQS
jgi:ATP-dependent Clp protease ATP-binding subunit ClpA